MWRMLFCELKNIQKKRIFKIKTQMQAKDISKREILTKKNLTERVSKGEFICSSESIVKKTNGTLEI